MLGPTVIVISFVTALLGVLHDHKAKLHRRSYLGLTPLGVALVVLAIGMLFGIADEVSGIRKENERTTMLKAIYAKTVGAQQETQDPTQAALLKSIANQIADAASHSRRGSNFSLSDFTGSDFSGGNFTQANFKGALFNDANLKGADLSSAVTDANTRLPKM